jgi:hypothetical protein
MKKIAFILLVVTSMFVIVSCPDIDGLPGMGGMGETTPSTRKFWAQNLVTNTFYQLTAEKLAENSRCEVWVERGSGVTAATANSVANEYSSKIYPKMMDTFGWKIEMPLTNGQTMEMNTMEVAHALALGGKIISNPKLTILLLDIKDKYKPKVNESYIAGYFYPFDFYENDPNYPQFKSNQLDMIYVDTYPSVPGSSDSNETLAHEMQHLMNFVSSALFRDNAMDTWINEGLSSAAEWVYSGQHPEGRWKYYNQDPSGLIKKGNNFYIWDNHSNESDYANLDDYATAYLFFQYLRIQNSSAIYFNIHTSNFTDYQAVTTATDINISHKNNWPLLLRDWHAANYTNATSGLYGYKNDTTLKEVRAPMVPGGTTSVDLFPGEGVYSKTTTTGSSVPANSGNINYAGLSPTGSTGVPSSTTSANGAQLTYNVDTNLNGLPFPGSTTGNASAGISITDVSGSVQIASNKFSGPYKVDAGYFLRRNGNRGIPDIEKTRNIISKNNSRSIDETVIILEVDRSTLERVIIDE